jgi:hypothetical protein
LENKAVGKKKRKDKKRPGSKKRKKTAQLQIHDTVPVPLEMSRPGCSEIDSPHEARFRMGNIAPYPAPLDT